MSKNDDIKAIYAKVNDQLKSEFKAKCAVDKVSMKDKLADLIQKYVGKK